LSSWLESLACFACATTVENARLGGDFFCAIV
jgi:hypothetical protein